MHGFLGNYQGVWHSVLNLQGVVWIILETIFQDRNFSKKQKINKQNGIAFLFFCREEDHSNKKKANTLGREEDHLNKKRPVHWLSLDTFEVNSASPDGRDPRVDILEIFLYL